MASTKADSDKPKMQSRDLQSFSKELTKAAALLQSYGKPLFEGVVVALPLMIKYGRLAKARIQQLPQNVINFIIGFVFCFFGGLYPVLFAAVEAAEYAGRKAVMESLNDLAEEAVYIIEESLKDDQVDKDNDGKSDVKEISERQWMVRKTKLVLTKMDPAKVDRAINNIYKVWLSVAAVLTIEFARTISMALAISDFIKQPVNRYLTPTVQLAIPDEYDRWVPVVVGWLCKSAGMSIAWYIQTVQSAFASALTGGLMMARALYQMAVERGYTFGGLIKAKHEDSYLDEMLSYVFAATGFFWQFMLGFDMPYPFNLVLWPFELLEFYMRWSITKAAGE